MTARIGKRFWRIVLIVLILALPIYYYTRGGTDAAKFVTAPVTRGPIVRSVTATGTSIRSRRFKSGPMFPVQSIAINVDFNSPVKAGQLMAKIDPRPYQAQVDLAQAALANSRAQLRKDQANLAYQKITWHRDAQLLKESVVSQDTAR